MKKLRLEMEGLRVESFHPASTSMDDSGTVHGHASLNGTCFPTCGTTCPISCQMSCGNTCPGTCYRTCGCPI